MPERIPQSVAIRVPLKAYLASDHISPAPGVTVAVVISKNGAGFGNPSAGATNATEISNGWYYLDLSTIDTGTVGPLIVRGTSATIDPSEVIYNVTTDLATINGKLDVIDDFLDTEIAAIKAKTDNLPADPADASDIAAAFATVNANIALVPTATDNADALLKRNMASVSGEASRSPLNALRALRNMVDLATIPGTMIVKKEDDSTDAWTAVYTTNVDALPITKVDPA